MHILNRILALLFLLLVVVLGILLMLFPREVLAWTRMTATGLERSFTPLTQAVFVVAGLALALIAIILLLLGLSPRRPATVRLLQVNSGDARLTTDAIAQRIKHELETLPDVQWVQPRVYSRGASIDLHLGIEADPDADVGPIAERACQLAREIAETRMGVRVNKVRAAVSHGAPHEGQAMRPAPAAVSRPDAQPSEAR
jgi:hypothetical protein